MAEDTWLKNEREYFVTKELDRFKILKKTLNDILERYNKFLQKALLGESPFIAEDLKITIERARGVNAEPENN